MPLSDAQRAVKGIGSSLIADIVGVSPYGSPTRAYNALVDPDSLPDISDRAEIMLGNILEAGACSLLALVADLELRELPPAVTLFHQSKPFLIAHPDRLVVGERACVEAKTRGPHMLKYYNDNDNEPLVHEYVQCQHQMLVGGFDACYLMVLFTNRAYKWWRILPNEDDHALILREGEAFWNEHYLPRVPPDPVTEDEIKMRFPVSVLGKTVEGNSELEEVASRALALREHLDELEAQYEAQRALLMGAMGDAETLRYDGRVLATFKSQKRVDLDVKRLRAERPEIAKEFERTGSFRALRIKTPLPAAAHR